MFSAPARRPSFTVLLIYIKEELYGYNATGASLHKQTGNILYKVFQFRTVPIRRACYMQSAKCWTKRIATAFTTVAILFLKEEKLYPPFSNRFSVLRGYSRTTFLDPDLAVASSLSKKKTVSSTYKWDTWNICNLAIDFVSTAHMVLSDQFVYTSRSHFRSLNRFETSPLFFSDNRISKTAKNGSHLASKCFYIYLLRKFGRRVCVIVHTIIWQLSYLETNPNSDSTANVYYK